MQRKTIQTFVEPMMALAVRELPGGGNWIYEIKLDGYRALALKSGTEVQLVSRNRTSFSRNYPDLIDSLKKLPARSATIDGEIVALDPNGKSSFHFFRTTEKRAMQRWFTMRLICCFWMEKTCDHGR